MQDRFKIDSEIKQELLRVLHPKADIVTNLPDPKEAHDLSEVLQKNSDGTYTEYRMVNGKWMKRGNLT